MNSQRFCQETQNQHPKAYKARVPIRYMPDLKTHTAISKQRTGKSYTKLHKWIDEPSKCLGRAHRIERHNQSSDYQKYIEKLYGKKGVIEWLVHIALDNLETANKLAEYIYRKPYTRMEVEFKKRRITDCVFKK